MFVWGRLGSFFKGIVFKGIVLAVTLSISGGTACGLDCESYWDLSVHCAGADLPTTADGKAANAGNTIGLTCDKTRQLWTGDVTLNRKSYYYRINGKNKHSAGGSVKEKLWYRVVDGNVNSEWKVYDDKVFHEEKFPSKEKEHIYNIREKSLKVDLSNILDEVDINNERGYVTVRFKFAVEAHVSVPSRNCTNNHEKIVCSDEVSVKVYKCDGGQIKAAQMTPKKAGSNEDIYYVYEDDDGYGISIENEEDPTIFSLDNQSYNWVLYNNNQTPLTNWSVRKNNASYNYGYSFTYQDLRSKMYGLFKPGTEFYIGRLNYLDQYVQCESNLLHYLIVPKVVLPGFEEKIDRMFCERTEETENVSECLYIEGQKAELLSGYTADMYGIQYQWEYKIAGHGWKTLSFAKNHEDDPSVEGDLLNYSTAFEHDPSELYVKREQMKKGLVYQFRQKIVLQNFSNRVIYAQEGEGSFPTARFQTYENIVREDFVMDRLPKVCEGATSASAIRVNFNPAQPVDKYNLVRDGLDYTYVAKGTDYSGSVNGLNLEAEVDALVTKDVPVLVTVKDGCDNAIELKDTIKVKALPVLEPAMIEGLNCSTTPDRNGRLNILVAQGQTTAQITVNPTDENYATSKYEIALGNETESGEIVYGDWTLLNKVTGYTIQATKYGYARIRKVTDGCESVEVVCVIQNCETFINTIGIGATRETEYRICGGDANPAILSDILMGAYGKDSYTYAWKYSLDGEIWSVISDQNDVNLPSGVIAPKADVYYILREVTSTMGLTQISSRSNVITVTKYSTPDLVLTANGEGKDLFACYGDTLRFAISDQVDVASEGATLRYNLCYKDASNIFHACYSDWSRDPQYSQVIVTRDTTFYGAAVVCGDTVYTKPISVSVGKRLDQFDVTLGACRVKGDSVRVTLPTATGFTYNFIYGDRVYGSDVTSIFVKLPLADKATYKVKVSSGSCSRTVEKHVEDYEMQEPLIHHPLVLDGNMKDGRICAGDVVQVSSQNAGRTDILGYSWYENGDQLAGTSSLLDYTPKTAGAANTLVRKTDLYAKGTADNEYCMSVFDTVIVRTHESLEFGEMAISDSRFCYGDTAVVFIGKASGGSGDGITYNLYKKDDDANTARWVAKAENFAVSEYRVKDAVRADGAYSVSIRDVTCKSEIYSDSIVIGEYDVDPDNTFTLKTSKTYVEESEVEDGRKVGIVLSSPEIDQWFTGTVAYMTSVNYTLNGGLTKSGVYGKGSGLSLKIGEEDFNDEGVLRIGMTRNPGTCSYTAFIDIFYSKGFNAQPQVKCEESASEIEIAGCKGSDVHLYVDTDNMPTYNESSMDLKRVSYQWYKLGEQSTVQLGGETSSSLTATVGDSAAYRCQVIYDAEGTGMNLKRVYSTTYIVKPVEVAQIGSVYFGQAGTYTKYACAGSSQKITLDADVRGNAKTTRMVWQSSTDGNSWTDLANMGSMVTGATTANCQVNVEQWSSAGVESVYFRLKVENTECGETAYSDNTIVLRIEERPKMDISKVRMDGNGVIDGTLTDISFYNYRDADFVYNWSYGNTGNYERKSIYTITNNKGFIAGGDSVYVFKESGRGCVSDTAVFRFNLFNTLSAQWNRAEYAPLCPDDRDIEMSVLGIQGGTGKLEDYKIEWQYRTADMTSFDVIAKGRELPFGYDLVEPSKITTGVRTSIIFNNVKAGFELRAVISCDGYPGADLALPVKNIETVSRIRKGWIDAGEETVCYDEPFVMIDAQPAEGGTGTYVYRWQKSTDKETWEDIREQESYRFSGRVEMPEYRLQKTTYFRRITTDRTCPGLADTSAVKTVLVLPEVKIPANVLSYYSTVLSGENVKIQPVMSEYDYIWNKIGAVGVEDTTYGLASYGAYTTEPLYGRTSYRYRVRYQNTPYCMSAWDTITVDVLETGAVELFFENQVANTDRYDSEGRYWICSGGEAGTIRANGSNGSTRHQWMYGVNGGNMLKMFYQDGTPATGETVVADECQKIANALKNTETTAPADKYVAFCRVDTFIAGNRVITVPSDTVRVYIVPSLTLSADVWNMADDLAGVLAVDKRNYCVNEEAESIMRNVSQKVEDFWFAGKMTPKMYDNRRSNDSLRISWEYAVGAGSNEWTTVKDVSVENYPETRKFNIGDYVDSPSGVYLVRTTLSDGCSEYHSNTIRLNWSDVKVEEGNVKVFAVTDDDNVITRGFEIGDSIVFQCNNFDYPCYWFADAKCTDTIKAGTRTCGFRLEGDLLDQLMSDPHIYVKRYDDATDCFSSATAVGLSFGTRSEGGKISSSQKICLGSSFNGLAGRTKATGNYLYPENENMTFTYTWQYSTDARQKTWVSVSDHDGMDLPKEKVDSIVGILNKGDYWFRRMAVNDSGRVCYSDTLHLNYYDKLEAGELSLSSPAKSYCDAYQMPVVRTTRPTGGYTTNDNYGYEWQLKVNDGGFVTVMTTPLDSIRMAYLELDTLDRTVNNTITVRCVFSDLCGESVSNEVSVELSRWNLAPAIYEDNECGADTILVRVGSELVEKTYTWLAYDEDGEVSWSWNNVDHKKIYRYMEGQMAVVNYGVYSVDVETGCESAVTEFNIDSMPQLNQTEPTAPAIVCYASAAEIKGGEVSGGTGDKTYQWQYSYDLVEWTTDQAGDGADYVSSKIVLPRWFRRLVYDKCNVDTSEAVLVEPTEKVDLAKTDFAFGDYTCALREIKVDLTDTTGKYTSDDYWVFTSEGSLWHKKVYNGLRTMDGFDGDSKTFEIIHYRQFQEDLVCKSEPVSVTLYNAPGIKENVIGIENPTPCNGTFATIGNTALAIEDKGERTADELLTLKWYVGRDNRTWTEQLLKNEKELDIRVQDTMYVRRVAYNGCAADTSNTVLIIGQKVEDYDYVSELGLLVVSNMRDSSVTMEIHGGKTFDDGYYFIGDGQLPEVSGNIVSLPYRAEVYKDSVLQLVAVSETCVSQYDVHPLRGGVISFDGDSVLCGGGEIPSIVATDIQGGAGSYTYQWQYNNQFTSDFINIDGATGKEYTPAAVSVATSYRRVTTSGEYVSYSNVVNVNIRPLPKAKDIYVSLSDSALATYGLNKTQYSVEKLPLVEMSLRDSVSDVDAVMWQKSYDGVTWENAELQEPSADGLYEYYITDTLETVYYRIVGTSACGEVTGKPFKVVTVYAPLILDDELVLTNDICLGDPYVRIRYKKEYSDVYSYTYRTIGYEGSGVFAWANSAVVNDFGEEYWQNYTSHRLNDTTKTALGAIFTYPKHSFDVEVTRIVNATGASSTKLVHFTVNDLSATFSYIVDGVELHQSGEPEQSVRLNQGSRVVFTPEVEGGNESLTYKWNLIAPLNTEYYNTYGGSVGREGLTSTLESPACYFYNGGVYTIQMTVSDGMCTAMVRDSALYIDRNTVRSFRHSVSLEEEVDDNYVDFFNEYVYVDIYPTLITDYCMINTNSKKLEHYEIYDASGMKVKEGDFIKTVRIETSALPTGVYVIRVGDKIVKLVK